MSKNQIRCLIAVTLFVSSTAPAFCQSKDQVDRINKWFDHNKEDQKQRDKYWQDLHTGPIQTPGKMQKPGTMQKSGTFQAPVGWKAIKTSDLPCQKRFAISGDTLFEFDRDTLTPHAVTTLNLLIPELKKQTTHPVTIEGHTDSIGPDEYNFTLSTRRAARVKSWLAENKIWDATNIKVVGHGKRIPVAPNTKADGSDNPEGRQLNRRVEIVVNTCVTLDKPATETATTEDQKSTATTSDNTTAPSESEKNVSSTSAAAETNEQASTTPAATENDKEASTTPAADQKDNPSEKSDDTNTTEPAGNR